MRLIKSGRHNQHINITEFMGGILCVRTEKNSVANWNALFLDIAKIVLHYLYNCAVSYAINSFA